MQQNNQHIYFICLPEILGISYGSLLVQRINITSTPRIKSIILENKTKKAQAKKTKKTPNSLRYDLGFAEINMQLDQQHFHWGDLTISQVKYEKKKFQAQYK